MKQWCLSFFLALICLGADGECSHQCEPLQEKPSHQTLSTIEGINEFDQILLLIQKWLAAMHEVARWKWQNGIPFDDLGQESLLIEKHLVHAVKLGIPKNWIEAFAKAQLEAARIIQNRDLKELTGIGKCGDRACDYATELYPYLSEITSQIFEKIGKIYPFLEEYTSSCHFLIQPPLSQRQIDRLPPHAWIKALSPFCVCNNKECHLDHHHH